MSSAPEIAGLEARALACERGNRLLFRDLDLDAGPGAALQVRGPNGAGKTSLLRILCGLGEPVHGEVRWQGHRVGPGNAAYLAELAYLGHADGIKRELTPLENLVAHCRVRGAGGLAPDAAVERLGLAAQARTPVRALSAGQRRRTALARLLTTRARLWILDEPLNALDADGIDRVIEMLRDHLERGGTAVLTSHLPVSIPGHALGEISVP